LIIKSALADSDHPDGFIGSLRMHITDETYEVADTYIVDLESLFVISEDSTYRDEY
jgi:hypothetical protein